MPGRVVWSLAPVCECDAMEGDFPMRPDKNLKIMLLNNKLEHFH